MITTTDQRTAREGREGKPVLIDNARPATSPTREPHAAPYTVDEVAAMLRVSRSSVYAAIKSGELGHFRVGRVIRVTSEHVDAFAAGGWVAPR